VNDVVTTDCLFCKIIDHQIPSDCVYEDDLCMVIKDIAPSSPVHLLILPKEHIISLNEVNEEHLMLLGHMQLVASRLAQKFGIADQGYRLVNNCGEWGGQAVLHLHYHLLGGKEMGWPPE
jgi:histidine triad (HIT) family protein